MASLKPYKKYKPVVYDYVKQLPADWQLLPNIAIFHERKEKGTENEEPLTISAIRGIVKSSDYENRKDRTSDDKSEYLLVKKDDLAYNTMLMWDGAVGHSSFRGIVSPAYTVLKAKIEINPKFFHYQMRTEYYKNYSKRFSYGIVDSRLRLYYVHFKRMYSIVPPLEVQNAIVEYLDKKNDAIDKFIRNKERLIELLEEEKAVIVNRTITKGVDAISRKKKSGITWIGEYPQHWQILKLRFLGNCQNGINIDGDQFGYGSPFVSYGDVYKNFTLPENIIGLVNASKSDQLNYSVKEDDIFFTRTSETIEEIGLASTCLKTIANAVFAGFLIRFRPKKNTLYRGYSKFFFRAIIHRAYFVREVNLVTRASLSQDLLKGLPVLLPPIQEQMVISEYLEQELAKRDYMISNAKKEISSIQEYREAIITAAVTGQLNVTQPKAQLQMS
jgi:type I restriction enzyme, S subunit